MLLYTCSIYVFSSPDVNEWFEVMHARKIHVIQGNNNYIYILQHLRFHKTQIIKNLKC